MLHMCLIAEIATGVTHPALSGLRYILGKDWTLITAQDSPAFITYYSLWWWLCFPVGLRCCLRVWDLDVLCGVVPCLRWQRSTVCTLMQAVCDGCMMPSLQNLESLLAPQAACQATGSTPWCTKYLDHHWLWWVC